MRYINHNIVNFYTRYIFLRLSLRHRGICNSFAYILSAAQIKFRFSKNRMSLRCYCYIFTHLLGNFCDLQTLRNDAQSFFATHVGFFKKRKSAYCLPTIFYDFKNLLTFKKVACSKRVVNSLSRFTYKTYYKR